MMLRLPAGHRARLETEARLLKQPFGRVRQSLNRAVAVQRATQLQDRQLARLFARLGLEDLAREGLMTRTLDVTDAAAVTALLADLAQQGLRVGTLVNNAGYGAMGPMLDVPAEEWQRQFDVNVFAPLP